MAITAIVLIFLSLPINIFSLISDKNSCPKFILYPISDISSQCYNNPDVLSDVPSMVKRHGYEIETHSVVTDDGYYLTLFQILPNNENVKVNPVYIQHGIVQNSGCWVDIGNRSLAFNLADEGYEVWIGNARGTQYSQKHQTLSVSDSEYWDFNLDTLAKYDLGAELGYIFEKNNQKIHYIGHSMGTSLCLMFLSEFSTKANQWILSASLLAPVAYLDGVVEIELVKIPSLGLIDTLDLLDIKGLFYQEDVYHKLLNAFCKVIPHICFDALNIAFGKTEQFLPDDLLTYFSYWPSGVSIFQLKQYLQIAQSGRFQKYDYGSEKNLKIYGTEQSPVYDLSKINVPVCLFYGENDSLYKEKNLLRLYNEMGTKDKCKHSIPSSDSSEKFSHFDFLYASHIITNLYEKVFANLKQWEK